MWIEAEAGHLHLLLLHHKPNSIKYFHILYTGYHQFSTLEMSGCPHGLRLSKPGNHPYKIPIKGKFRSNKVRREFSQGAFHLNMPATSGRRWQTDRQHCVYCIVVFRGEIKYLTSVCISVAETAQSVLACYALPSPPGHHYADTYR